MDNLNMNNASMVSVHTPDSETEAEVVPTEKDDIDTDSQYVKAGVGGLFVYEYSNHEYALLYRRLPEEDPDPNKWSLPGGGAEFWTNIEETLQKKAAKKLGIRDKKNVEVLGVITVVNHQNEHTTLAPNEDPYHYISPQYYINIMRFKEIFKIDDQNKGKGIKLHIFTDAKEFVDYNSADNQGIASVALVSLDMIQNMENRHLYFIETTYRAVDAHIEIMKQIKDIENHFAAIHSEIDASKKNLLSYKEWRKKG